MYKKFLVVFLCLTMVLGTIPSAAFAQNGSGIEDTTIYSSGKPVHRVELPENEKVSLAIDCGLMVDYQWQILMDEDSDLWINIMGSNSSEISIGYAMIANMMDGDTATIRCRVIRNKMVEYSDPVEILVVDPVFEAEDEIFADEIEEIPEELETEIQDESVVEEPEEEIQDEPAAEEPEDEEIQDEPAAEEPEEEEIQDEPAAEEPEEEEIQDEPAAEEPEEEEIQDEPAAEEPEEEEIQDEPAAEEPEEEEIQDEPAAEEPEEEEIQDEPAVVEPAEEEVPDESDKGFLGNLVDMIKNVFQGVQKKAPANMLDLEDGEPETDNDAEPETGNETEPGEETASDEENGSEPEKKEYSKSKYSIVIDYKFENGDYAAESYTAEIAAGTSFTDDVSFPEIVGYDAYLDGAKRNNVIIDIEDADEDVSYHVTYMPGEVDFTITHYLQNVDNDEYTKDSTEYETGITNEVVGDNLQNHYSGFYNLPYERPVIAADGSTEVEIYYDRYYYLMNFSLGDGYGTEPIYARYGAPIEIAQPENPGYTFAGWSLTEGGTEPVEEMPETMPAKSATYYAIWEAAGVSKVTVVYWGQNADDDDYSYLSSEQINVATNTRFTYTPGATYVCGLDEHVHSSSCAYTCGLEEHQHSMSNGCYSLTCDTPEHNHTEDCGMTGCTHVHTKSCYGIRNNQGTSNKGLNNDHLNGLSSLGLVNGCIYQLECTKTLSHRNYTGTEWFLYYDNKWYQYDSNKLPSISLLTQLSQKTENGAAGSYCRYTKYEYKLSCHTHTDDCYDCDLTTHTHTQNDCYTLTCTTEPHKHNSECPRSCGLIEHVHNNECRSQGPELVLPNSDEFTGKGLSDLYTYKESDVITVNPDGSSIVNVYYDRKSFTLHFRKASSNKDDYGTITAKWGESIIAKWQEKCTTAKNSLWSRTSGGGDPWTAYLPVMPPENRTYYINTSNATAQTATYYIKTLDGTDALYFTSTVKYGGTLSVSNEEYIIIDGFTINKERSAKVRDTFNGAKFYYDRNHYNLTFNNGLEDVKTESVLFELPLNEFSTFVPAAPSNKEPGSVEFDGWYLNPQCTGEEYKLSEHTMPSANLLLYAKWKPVSHTVEFYLDDASLEAGTKLEGYDDITLSHGAKIGAVENPKKGSYKFISWFYKENGVEKAFDPVEMPVRSDLKLYGKWSSDVLKGYKVYFKIEGTDTEIADPITGMTLAGNTKTFDAKGDDALYPDYQEGYFPMEMSHSITLDIEENDYEGVNAFTFEYVCLPNKPYTVKYLDEVTLEPVAPEKYVEDNRKAVVTEVFVPVAGKMPDAYRKRLVVSAAEDAVNEIIFYYKVDYFHAFYSITHYTENVAGDGWDEYRTEELKGAIDNEYSAKDIDIKGFTFDDTIEGTLTSGKLTADGLELKLYYTRNEYPYTVKYLEEGTRRVLHEEKTADAKFGTRVVEDPIDILGYEPVDSNSQQIVINTTGNVITFFYKKALADLTITKAIDSTSGAYANGESFIIHVDGVGNNYHQTVVVKAGQSVTLAGLQVGTTYAVTEDAEASGWSWRYRPAYKVGEDATNKITIQDDRNAASAVNVLTVTNELTNDKWFSVSAVVKNVFRKK